MTDQNLNGHTFLGTIGGTITILVINISASRLIETAVFAAIGAAVSFLTSYILQYWLKKKVK